MNEKKITCNNCGAWIGTTISYTEIVCFLRFHIYEGYDEKGRTHLRFVCENCNDLIKMEYKEDGFIETPVKNRFPKISLRRIKYLYHINYTDK